jgi:hypothetical protein
MAFVRERDILEEEERTKLQEEEEIAIRMRCQIPPLNSQYFEKKFST